MRIIGRIEAKFNEEGTPDNLPYLNGYIVELTSYEANLLRGLQDACRGEGWDMVRMLNDPYHYKPEDVDMAEAFGMVRLFMETRFAVNSFKQMVDGLEETLNRLDKNEL